MALTSYCTDQCPVPQCQIEVERVLPWARELPCDFDGVADGKSVVCGLRICERYGARVVGAEAGRGEVGDGEEEGGERVNDWVSASKHCGCV